MPSRHPFSFSSRLLLGVFALVACITSALAQSARWSPASGSLARGETTRLELVFEDCAPKGTPDLPAITGLEFGNPSTSQRSSFNIVNGSATRSSTVTLSYPVIANAELGETITIPALSFETKDGRVTAPAATFTVGTATVGNNQTNLSDIARSRFLLPPGPIWAGQVFPLGYTLEVSSSHFYQLASHVEWKPSPLLIEDWPQPDMTEVLQNGVRSKRINYRTNALAATPGDIVLQPAAQRVNLTTGTTSFGFFGRPEVDQYTINSEPVTLTVKPLPQPAPPGFTGAVGNFTLTAKAVPLKTKVGEPITWTLTLSGNGNWPVINSLPARDVSKDFSVVQPQAKRTPASEGALFDATLSEDVVLIPTRPGTHTLGPVSLTVFDPAKGEYRTLTTESFNVTVSGVAATPTQNLATGGPSPSAGSTTPMPPVSSDIGPAPTKPTAAIPLDPIAPAGIGTTPLSTRSLVWLSLLPFALPPILWLVFALRRAGRTDPALPRREAHARLLQTIDQLTSAPSPEGIRAWRDDTSALWQLSVATPTPRDFPDPVWAALWAESERALYRSDTALAPEWIQQAREVLAAHPVPKFSVWQLFRGRNLFPWANAVVVLLVLTAVCQTVSAADTDTRESYTAGDFKAAESGWRDRIQESPTDWSARYNLSLALAQQDRWAESAAHAGIAWLQQPASPQTRWQLALAASHEPKTVAAFASFVRDNASPLERLARLAPPSCWQLLIIAAGILGSVALTLLVLSGYTRIPVGYGLTLLVLALIAGAVGATALKTFGPLLKRDTALVWQDTTLYSVPTEAATEQQTSTIRAGTLTKVGRNFLGWRQVTLPNEQTGWVRADTLAGLWSTP